MARKLKRNLRTTEEQAMLAGMVALLRGFGYVERVEAYRKGGLALRLDNGLSISVIPDPLGYDFAEVGWWPTGAKSPGMETRRVAGPDQLGQLLAELATAEASEVVAAQKKTTLSRWLRGER
jgi:hypothetical protein